MVTVYMLVEGPTERTFVDLILAPHLANFSVYCYAISANGLQTYARFKSALVPLLREHDRRDVIFSTMIDLYKYPTDSPRHDESLSLRHIPLERAVFLESAMREEIGDARLIPYLQTHEFESILFVKPSVLSAHFPAMHNQIAELINLANGFANPELINDGEQTAPSKRIIRLIPKYSRSKVLVGPIAAKAIGIDVIRQKCSHFDDWVRRLERLSPM